MFVEESQMVYLVASMMCIGAISGLSSQQTVPRRLGTDRDGGQRGTGFEDESKKKQHPRVFEALLMWGNFGWGLKHVWNPLLRRYLDLDEVYFEILKVMKFSSRPKHSRPARTTNEAHSPQKSFKTIQKPGKDH